MKPFTATTTVSYQPERVPPRCRNPRPVREEFVLEVDIPSVSGAEAPVAAMFGPGVAAPAGVRVPEAGLRTWDGKLYTRAGATNTGSQAFAERSAAYWHGNRAEAEADVRRGLEKLLLIDGEAWEQTGEPFYRIMGFGWGNNHGGTSLTLQSRYDNMPLSDLDYALTEPEAALEGAIAFARGRGDTRSAEFMTIDRPKILIPEAFTIPSNSLRSASKEAELRVMADNLAALLKGSFDREGLRTAKNRLQEMHELMLQHGIEEV